MLTAGPQRRMPARWRLSGHARRLVTMALAGLFIAVITRRAEFAGLAAPALLLLVPRQRHLPEDVTVELATGADRVTEGGQGVVVARVTWHGQGTLQLWLRPAPWITADLAVPGDDGWFRLPYRAELWGVRPVGFLEVILRDRWRLAESRFSVALPEVTCYPLPARLESRVVLSKLPARLGEHTSRLAGEGTEFAGVREFVPGDRQRRINWPATTRRGTLQLNTFAAERAQVVVVLMDISVDVGTEGSSTADLAVRATLGAAASYLAARDRVGLVSFGDRVRWISPAHGRRQGDRIMDMIMSESRERGPADRGRGDVVTRLPHAALPAGALIIVFSPLLNLRLIEALRELRERGFATIVVDVLCAEPDTGYSRSRGAAELAKRIWRMEQEAIRFSLRELGIAVVRWDGQSSLDEPLAPYTRRPMVVTRA